MTPEAVPSSSGPSVVGTWLCPFCNLVGQVWLGNISGTSLHAHVEVVHPERARHPSVRNL